MNGASRRIAIIGHRGVGKTSFLERVRAYHASVSETVLALDLDREIEKRSGCTIADIFSRDGEAKFRSLERETFAALDRELATYTETVYVACGGGFDPEQIPPSWTALWIRRATDRFPRTFVDRPPMDLRERWAKRESAYARRADETLILDEGLDHADDAERAFVLNDVHGLGGWVTVVPCLFRRGADGFRKWAERRKSWGIEYFELRDDLLSLEQIRWAIEALPRQNVLLSFRSIGHREDSRALARAYSLAFDWPLEFGICDWGTPRVFSLHERSDGLTEALARFPHEVNEKTILKAALPVENFSELAMGETWWKESPHTRVFLPISNDGRWAWYRLLHNSSFALNFWREGDGSSLDQPTWLKWWRARQIPQAKTFAAVLGDPVEQSRTPMEQREFFASRAMPVFAIRVTESEMRSSALEVLRELGLRNAAVTSPLKEIAAEKAGLGSAMNTLVWIESAPTKDGRWRATNTDVEGFRAALEPLRSRYDFTRVAVWGGGGTLAAVREILPNAQFIALRTRENRDPHGLRAVDVNPEVVIWSVGRSHAEVNAPPEMWHPRVVVDLNYADDSPGRDYALKVGAEYVSGLAMFREQARAQREFWSSTEAVDKKDNA